MRILIVKLAAIGDVVMALSMLPAARALHPNCHITWLCGAEVRPLLSEVKEIDEILTVDTARLLAGSWAGRIAALVSVWTLLWGRRFDLIAVGHSDPRYRLLTLTARARLRRSFGRTGARPMPLPGRHHSHEYARLITGREGPDGSAGILPQPPRLGLPRDLMTLLETAEGKPLVLLAPGGARNVLRDDRLRRWPTSSYGALARRLVAAGCGVGLVGSAGDGWVRAAFSGIPVIDLIGRTTLPDLLAVLGSADMVVAHDTSVLHLARWIGTPVVALFGPTSPQEKMFPDDLSRTIWGGAALPCRPCYDGRAFADCSSPRCLESVTVDEVETAAIAVLSGIDTRQLVDA